MQVFMLEKRYVEVRKAARERLEKAEKEHLCVACMEALNGRPMRGMHMRCYHATMRAIRTGKTTEEDRVAQGKMLEPAKTGRKPSNPVTQEVG